MEHSNLDRAHCRVTMGVCLIALSLTLVYGEEDQPQKAIEETPLAIAIPIDANYAASREAVASGTQRTMSRNTMSRTVKASHPTPALIPKSKRFSKDPGAPEFHTPARLFDPQRHESPIRTARLFRIVLPTPLVAEPVVE